MRDLLTILKHGIGCKVRAQGAHYSTSGLHTDLFGTLTAASAELLGSCPVLCHSIALREAEWRRLSTPYRPKWQLLNPTL